MEWIAMALPMLACVLFLLLLAFLHYRGLSFTKRVFLSLIGGGLLGVLLNWLAGYHWLVLPPTATFLHLISEGYVAFLRMLVVPLVFTSIVAVMMSLGKTALHVIRRFALGSVLVLLVLTAISCAIGMGVAECFGLGKHLMLPAHGEMLSHPVYPDWVDKIYNLLPKNPVMAMIQNNAIAMVTFAALFGWAALIVLKTEKREAQAFYAVINGTFEICKRLALLVIEYMPYGIFPIIATVCLSDGIWAIVDILDYVLATHLAMLLVGVIHLLMVRSKGIGIKAYLRYAYPALVLGFTSRSSFAVLPVSEEVLSGRFKTSAVAATFVPGVGSTVGLNASCGVLPGVLVVMALNITHTPLTFVLFAKAMLVSTFVSIGVVGIPGSGVVVTSLVLTALGLPDSTFALVQGVDPLEDMSRTAVNVNGTLATALLMDHEHCKQMPANEAGELELAKGS